MASQTKPVAPFETSKAQSVAGSKLHDLGDSDSVLTSTSSKYNGVGLNEADSASPSVTSESQEADSDGLESVKINPDGPTPNKITDPSKFKDLLLPRLKDPVRISTTLGIHKCADKVFLSRHSDMFYNILPSGYIFELWNLDRSIPLQIQKENRSGQCLPYFQLEDVKMGSHFKYKLGGNKADQWVGNPGDIFLALGYIVERNNRHLYKVTQYVCAINVSTVPQSMWLIFDYGRMDKRGDLEEIESPDSHSWYTSSIYDCCKSHSGYADGPSRNRSPWIQGGGYMNHKEPWDIACLYPDIKHWPSSDPAQRQSARGGKIQAPELTEHQKIGRSLSAVRVKSKLEIMKRQILNPEYSE